MLFSVPCEKKYLLDPLGAVLNLAQNDILNVLLAIDTLSEVKNDELLKSIDSLINPDNIKGIDELSVKSLPLPLLSVKSSSNLYQATKLFVITSASSVNVVSTTAIVVGILIASKSNLPLSSVIPDISTLAVWSTKLNTPSPSVDNT